MYTYNNERNNLHVANIERLMYNKPAAHIFLNFPYTVLCVHVCCADAAGGLYDSDEEESDTEEEDERRKVTEFDSDFTDVEGEARAKKSDDDLVRTLLLIVTIYTINSNNIYY